MAKVLLAEDDPGIAEPLARALTRDGYEVEVAESGQLAIERAAGSDLLLLDYGLPDVDGSEVVQSIRKNGLSLPILVLTARADDADKILGDDDGADDYVTKPFRLAELLARVKALIKRGGQSESVPTEDLAGQDLRILKGTRRVFKGDDELHFTNKEFDLLRVLVENSGNVVLRETLMKDVWGNDPQGSTKTLDTHISSLRKKLDDDAEAPRYITTVKGLGFQFEAEGRDA